MSTPESYKAGYLDNFERKLLLPFSSEGSLNEDYLKAARDLDVRLSQYEDFVGVALGGSSALGYSTQREKSDWDYSILYDSEIASNTIPASASIEDEYFREKRGKLHLQVWDVSRASLLQEIQGHTGKFFDSFAGLAQPGLGAELRHYRSAAAEVLAGLPDDRRKAIMERIIATLVEKERMSFGKVQWRIAEPQGSWDESAIMAKRQELWEKRVRQVFKL
jgi:hypothetical protein